MDRPARTFVLPVPLSRMLAAYTLIKKPEPNIGTEILIPVMNVIEALNSNPSPAVRTRGQFPNDDAAMKLLHLGLGTAAEHCKRPPREWVEAKSRVAILFVERSQSV